MKTSTFVGNLIFWIAIAAVCGVFAAWYYTTDVATVTAAAAESSWTLVGTIAATPLLLYAIGAIVGLVVIKIGKFRINQSLKSHAFIVASLILALMIAGIAPVIALGPTSGYSMPTLLLSYAGVYAAPAFLIIGAAYSVGIAPAK